MGDKIPKMNANELMPKLEELKKEILKLIEKNNYLQAELTEAGQMILLAGLINRQQEAEIEALKEQLETERDAYCQLLNGEDY